MMPAPLRLLLILVLLAGCAPATDAPVPASTVVPSPGPTPEPEAPQLPWWRESVFYEIFVRSYYDTDGDGIGDFNGITEKLDYLQELGIDALWLMPIHPSPSYHGYDVINYYAVSAEYGTLADFRHLLAEAHERDMRVIVDLVINHTSSRHPWFQESDSRVDSRYRDYYLWAQGGSNGWHQGQNGFYYAFFCDCMPDLNYHNPDVTDEVLKITDYWLNEMGVDGFRVDAAKHLIEDGDVRENTPATHEWYRGFYTAYKAQNPQAYAVGEVFGAGASIVKSYTGDQLDQVFNFEMSSGIVNSVNGGANSGVTSATRFAQQDMPDFNFATFLTNHDQDRAMSVFNGDAGKARAAAALLLTAPGTPYIYYGEEIGMQGRKPDEDIRLPMQWSAEANAGFSGGTPWRAPAPDFAQINVSAQENEPASLLNHYRELIHLRRGSQALKTGDLLLLETASPAVYAVIRHSSDQKVLVLVNLRGTPVSEYRLSLSEDLLTDGTLNPRRLFGPDEALPVTVSDGRFSEYRPVDELLPHQAYVFELE